MTYDIAFGIGGIDAESPAEASLNGLRAGDRDDNAVIAAVLVIRVNGIGEKNAVEDFKTFHITGANSENDEVFALASRIDDLDVFTFGFEIHQTFGLREEEVFRASDGVQSVRKHFSVLPFFKLRSGYRVNGDIQSICLGDGGKKSVKFVKRYFTHLRHLFRLPPKVRGLLAYNPRSERGFRPRLLPDIRRKVHLCL